MREVRTAKVAAAWIERLGHEVSRDVGTTGLVGVLNPLLLSVFRGFATPPPGMDRSRGDLVLSGGP